MLTATSLTNSGKKVTVNEVVTKLEEGYSSFLRSSIANGALTRFCQLPFEHTDMATELASALAHNLVATTQLDSDGFETPREFIHSWIQSLPENADFALKLSVCLYETQRIITPQTRFDELVDAATDACYALLTGHWLFNCSLMGLYEYDVLLKCMGEYLAAFEKYRMTEAYMYDTLKSVAPSAEFVICPTVRPDDLRRQGFDVDDLQRMGWLNNFINSMDIPEIFNSHPCVDWFRDFFGVRYQLAHPSLETPVEQQKYAALRKPGLGGAHHPIPLALTLFSPKRVNQVVRVCSAFERHIIEKINRRSCHRWHVL